MAVRGVDNFSILRCVADMNDSARMQWLIIMWSLVSVQLGVSLNCAVVASSLNASQQGFFKFLWFDA